MKKIIFNISLERVKIQCQQWANFLSAPRVAHEVLPTWSAGLQPKTRLQAERHGPHLECLCVGPVPKVSPSSVVPTPPQSTVLALSPWRVVAPTALTES